MRILFFFFLNFQNIKDNTYTQKTDYWKNKSNNKYKMKI